MKQVSQGRAVRVSRRNQQAIRTMPDENIEAFDFSPGLILCRGNDKQRVIGSRDSLRSLSATGEERVSDAGNHQTNGLGAMALERARGLVWRITKTFNNAQHEGQSLG